MTAGDSLATANDALRIMASDHHLMATKVLGPQVPVAVIVPTYADSKFLPDALRSVESDTPVFEDNHRFRGHGNLYLHRDQVTLAEGDIRYLTEIRSDRHALVEMLLRPATTL